MKRFDIYLVQLNPTLGSEINKNRPCVIISPDEMNDYIKTVIVAPMTSAKKSYPTRVNCVFQNKKGQIVLDQIRTVDKIRLNKKVGILDILYQEQVLLTLAEMFAL
ncbi:MAG: type II toxin-antitoxin system PemK/MazF family toxin [Cyanobacterium sp. T60_A2020_053]|nr:type II toxin-antitoxin system PemK/MazF family toxin [Cyanobacterium sp. T60_A2020_053]